MAVSLKTAGTWAEYTTDLQSVTIPGTPAAGDRMFLFVAWKDFAITLLGPTGWTTIVNSYADGTASTGNGTGSMSQAIFYKDWQSGDPAPQLDFSTTTGLLAEAVVMLWQKGAGESWTTPRYVTSAHSFSTSSVYESADQTIDIADGSVVMCQVATRDDSATFTRTTTSIKDAGALITWNGNYVESPATHYSTTTGNDHAGDLGHRFVTTGASGVTLQAEAVQSAADSGSLVWVVQNVYTVSATTATPGVLALTTTAFAPSVTVPDNKTATPGVASLTTTAFAPTVRTPRLVTLGKLSLTLTPFAPTVSTPRVTTPGVRALSLTTYAPTVTASTGSSATATPSTAALSLATYAPTVSTPRLVTPGPLALTLTTYAPTVTGGTGGAASAVPGTATLTLTTYAPTVTGSVLPLTGGKRRRYAYPEPITDSEDDLLLAVVD